MARDAQGRGMSYREGNPTALRVGEGNSHGRVQCPACVGARYNLWGYPWPALRFARTVQKGRTNPRFKLCLYGRLCGSWLSFYRGDVAPASLQIEISL